MMKEAISEKFESGMVSHIDMDIITSELAWNSHPTFRGVYLKHLITGSQTNGTLSCHLVKIEPNCSIGNHIHEGKLEVHEVIQGKGHCHIDNRETPYKTGSIALIPADTNHEVTAGEEGLFILAKFSPALL